LSLLKRFEPIAHSIFVNKKGTLIVSLDLAFAFEADRVAI